MWSWSLSFDEIRADMVVGSCPMKPEDRIEIRDTTGISAFLSLQHDDCLGDLGIDYQKHLAHGRRVGLVMERCPMRDFDTEDQRKMLPAAVRMLHRLLKSERRVYVHCTAGINRSPLVVLAYLVWIEDQPFKTAWELLREKRQVCAPDRQAYQAARSNLVANHRNLIINRASQHAKGRDTKEFWEQASTEVIREILT
jgi:hypothetical protein